MGLVAGMETVPLREDFTPLLPTPLIGNTPLLGGVEKKSQEIPVETGLGVTSLLTNCISFFLFFFLFFFFYHVACLVGS